MSEQAKQTPETELINGQLREVVKQLRSENKNMINMIGRYAIDLDNAITSKERMKAELDNIADHWQLLKNNIDDLLEKNSKLEAELNEYIKEIDIWRNHKVPDFRAGSKEVSKEVGKGIDPDN